MKLQSKPVKPRRAHKEYELRIYGDSLAVILDYFESLLPNEGFTSEEITGHKLLDAITIGTTWDYDSDVACATLTVIECDKQFNHRMTKYQTKYDAYVKWTVDNKDAIHEEKMKRAEEQDQKKRDRIEKEMKRLERKLEKLES